MAWIKVKHPLTNETHTMRIQILDDTIYQVIKDHTRALFKFNHDYDFHFCLFEDGKQTLITESNQLLEYISDTSIQLEIVPIGEQAPPLLSTPTLKAKEPLSLSISEKQQFDILCDGCYIPIRGQRFRCETCEDFDLCSICKSRVNHNSTHIFQLICDPSDNNSTGKSDKTASDQQLESKSTSITSSTQTIYICDNCDSDIVGVRHTCSSCPDFDLCHSCFSIVKQNHPEQHQFTTHLAGAEFNRKQKKQYSDVVVASPPCDVDVPVQHAGVRCDYCQSQVVSIRYKCGHCANFDLCATCEEKAEFIHDKSHAFIKIRYPIQQLPQKPLLPEFKHMDATQDSSSSLTSSMTTLKSIDTSSASETDQLAPNTQNMTPTLHATLISDMSIPDGTITKPKESFLKIWKVQNTGNVDWPVGSNLHFNGGTILSVFPNGQPKSFAVPSLSAGESTCIMAGLQAPDSPGHYTSYFCLCTPDGAPFSDRIWCTIVVDDEKLSKSSMIFPLPSIEQNPPEYDSYEYDTYSTTTGDVSNTTVTYTDSQISCFSPDDESVAYENTSYADGEYEDEASVRSVHSEEASSETQDNQSTDDDFVLVDDDDEKQSLDASSTRSMNTVKDDEVTPTQSLHQDAPLVSEMESLEVNDPSAEHLNKGELALKKLVGHLFE